MLPKKEWVENLQSRQNKLVEPDIIFDEHQYVQSMLKTYFKPTQYQLNLLACYYYEQGKDVDFIKERLTDFVKKRIIKKVEDYSKPFRKWEYSIKMAIRYAQTNKLKSKTTIYISQREMDLIMSQDTIKKQNVLFVIACLSKFDKAQIEVPQHRKNYVILDFYKAKLTEKILRNFVEFKSINGILNEFKEKGYIKLIDTTSYKVNFVEKVNEENSVLKVVCDYSLVQYLNEYAKKMG